MNERIKELIEQNTVSTLVALPGGGARYKKVDGSLEKFAELVIRECALVVYNKTGPKSALNVLEHFGVKE